MERKCDRCGSTWIVLVKVARDYWRKECQNCGSTGPFLPVDPPPGHVTPPKAA